MALSARLVEAQGQRTELVQLDVDGNMTYGRSTHRLLGGGFAYTRLDSAWELSAQLNGAYSDYEDPTTPFRVDRRGGSVTAALERRPKDRWSLLLWTRAEGSLETQIALRYLAGAGVKYTLVRDDLGILSFSLAAIRSETRAAANAPANPKPDAWRWSARLKGDRRFATGRLRITSESYYQPLFEDANHFTFRSSNSIAWKLQEHLDLDVRWRYGFDSDAVARGAESATDGTVSLGLRAHWGSSGA